MTARTVGGISTTTNNQGTVEVNRGGTGMTTFSGALGAEGNQLEGLTLTAGNTAFTGNVFAQTLSRTAGVADFNGNVTRDESHAQWDGRHHVCGECEWGVVDRGGVDGEVGRNE